jgi:hypothetical protein
MQQTVDDVLREPFIEAGLRQLVWQYARSWSTVVFIPEESTVLATVGGREWLTHRDTLPAIRVGYRHGLSATWHDGRCYRLMTDGLWVSVDPVTNPWRWVTDDEELGVTRLVSVPDGLFMLSARRGVRRFCPRIKLFLQPQVWADVRLAERLSFWVAHVVIEHHAYLIGSTASIYGQAVTRVCLSSSRTSGTSSSCTSCAREGNVVGEAVTHWFDALCVSRSYCSAVVREGLIYVAGGYCERTVECFDPFTQKSRSLPSQMCFPRWGPSMALGDGRNELYVLGGRGDTGGMEQTRTVETYSFRDQTWRLLPLTLTGPVEDCIVAHGPS